MPIRRSKAEATTRQRLTKQQPFRNAIKTLGFSIFTGNCVLCRLPSQRPRDLCLACERSLRWLRLPCTLCALPAAKPGENISDTNTNIFSGTSIRNSSNQRVTRVCAQCARTPTLAPVAKTVAPLAYAGCAEWLVQQQKHRKGSVASRVLAELLGDAIAVQYTLADASCLPELLIPVPLHWRREWSRGHNQSALLAANLSRRFAIPTHSQLVQRVIATPSQRSLSKPARKLNLAGAFRLKAQAARLLRNRRVAIVDDVLTTGATACTLAETLLSGGAERVHLFAPTRAILTQ